MYKIYQLKNGMTLICEKMSFVKSVSVGIWVRAGSMYETESESGISHFIEHMLFKGTSKRSAKQIAEEIDAVGGQMNAYTSRECTCFYSRTLGDSLALQLDILSDMYYNSLFSQEDIDLEKSVILEEISMYEDSPEDLVLDKLESNMWKGSPLGFNVAGTKKSVKKLDRAQMCAYYKKMYTPENTVISVAGCFEESALINLCEKYFSQEMPFSVQKCESPIFHSGSWELKKDIEQSHIAMGFPAYDLSSSKIYTLSLMNNILGGSMSSRLFQSIRENAGLCYSIYSYTGVFPTAGMLGIYTGLNSNSVEKALSMIEKEIHYICSDFVTDYELKKVCGQLKCSVLMSRESVSTRMSENGKSLLLLGKIRTDEEIIKIIDSVTKNDIIETANDVFNSGNKATFILRNV